MGGLLILLALSVVMALASFLAGALPLSMTLSQSQLRLISSVGIGILVGTSLIVIIPEGIEAVASTSGATVHSHRARDLHSLGFTKTERGENAVALSSEEVFRLAVREPSVNEDFEMDPSHWVSARSWKKEEAAQDGGKNLGEVKSPAGAETPTESHEHEESKLPTFYIGFALTIGFVLMFLIDRLPRHATETLQTAPAPRHISLDNLASSSVSGEEDTEGFLSSITPSPKQSRSLATTTGLVIHAAADGIAMGASATTADMKLGFIIFAAIMIHKAPAAFGLTSVLLKQGLSKRAARGHLIVFSLAAPFGALATFLIISLVGGGNMDGETGQWWTGMLLLFSAGTFLYVAMHAHAMQEEGGASGHEYHSANGFSDGNGITLRKQTKPQMRETLATVVGMLFPLLTQFGHHH